MNDFTKEELVLLTCWSANRYDEVGSYQAKDEGTITLSHKIQNMIVNYCKHKADFIEPNDIQCKFCNKSLIGN